MDGVYGLARLIMLQLISKGGVLVFQCPNVFAEFGAIFFFSFVKDPLWVVYRVLKLLDVSLICKFCA